MSARLGIAVALVLAIVGGGYLLYGVLFDDAPAPAAAAPPDAAPSAAVPPDAVAATNQRVVVSSVEAVVERQVPGGDWEPIAAGAVLSPDDVLRTGSDGAVTVAVGQTVVRMDPNTQIAVPAITSTVSRVRLGQGRIAATVPESAGTTFGVDVEGSDAVAETEAGDFAVLSDGAGEAVVAAERGVVRVTAKQKTVEVAAGQQSVVRRDTAPTAPTAVPPSLFLKISSPGAKQRAKSYAVKGKTTPGAIISVNGVRVEVDETGEFSQVVALKEGRNKVTVASQDVTGRQKESEVRVVVDSTGPNVGGDVQWGNP